MIIELIRIAQVKRLIEKEKEEIKAMAVSQISTLHTQVIEQVRRDQVRCSSAHSITLKGTSSTRFINFIFGTIVLY